MAIDFPASPTVGQVFVVGSVTYTWDGTKWKSNATNSPFSLGSASTPSITFIGDNNTGIYSPGADQVAISTNGTGRLFVDANGRVGVGVSALAQAFTVRSASGGTTARFENTSSGNFIDFQEVTGNTRMGYIGHVNATDMYVHNDKAGPLIFDTNNLERLRITSAGLVGIGTSSPSRLLHVQSANGTPSQIQLGQSSQRDFYVGLPASSPDFEIFDASAGASRLRITAVGNVGIGTTSPASKLSVSDSGAVQIQATTGTVDFRIQSIDGNSAAYSGTVSNHAYAFTTNNSERARIDSSGRLLVGTSSSTTGVVFPSQIQSNAFYAYSASLFSADNIGSHTWFLKSRNATVNQHTAVQSGDVLGRINFAGSDGDEFIHAALIQAVVDNGAVGTAVSNNECPAALVFSTTADGAASPTERLRIDSSGNLTINSQGNLRFGDADNSNWVGFQAPATVASNVIWTLPAADGTASQVLGTNGSGVLSFLTAGASLNVAAKSTNYTAVAADKSYLFTATGSWTLSLTAAATLGNGWYLFLKNIGTGQITVDPNASELIGGVSTAVSNPGDLWLITCTGTEFVLNRLEGKNFSAMGSSGTFTVPAGVYEVFVEVQGAGGGGASATGDFTLSAGGSGGGYAAKWCRVTPGESISVTVGSGGAGGTSAGIAGSPGGSSSFNAASGTVTGSGGQGGATGLSLSTVLTNTGVGSGSGGDINISGGRGWCNLAASTSYVISFGGSSKFSTINSTSSYFGSSQSAGPTSAPGTGGGGASRDRFNSGYTGGNGLVLIQWV